VDRPAVPAGGGGSDIEGVVGVPIADRVGPDIPVIQGDAPDVGTTTKGLTPALPISTEPNGIPVRAT
jgi:hypothetical protein